MHYLLDFRWRTTCFPSQIKNAVVSNRMSRGARVQSIGESKPNNTCSTLNSSIIYWNWKYIYQNYSFDIYLRAEIDNIIITVWLKSDLSLALVSWSHTRHINKQIFMFIKLHKLLQLCFRMILVIIVFEIAGPWEEDFCTMKKCSTLCMNCTKWLCQCKRSCFVSIWAKNILSGHCESGLYRFLVCIGHLSHSGVKFLLYYWA